MTEPRKNIRYRSKTPSPARIRATGQVYEPGGDLYFALITGSFWRFLLAVAGFVLGINTLFACLYMLSPGCIANARPGSFEDAFFFSVQTFATIGYGTMAPQTLYAHMMVTVESVLGILAVGSFAGVAFARLSRPTARVLFSDKLVIRPRNGVPHLQFRVANWRNNLVIEAQVRLYILLTSRTTEGEVVRSPTDLKLVRSSNPVFFLTWTVMHPIDETSPFHGEDAVAKLRAAGAQLFASVTGYDQTLGQMVHAYCEFPLVDIVPNARFVDIVIAHPDGRREIDFGGFHEVEPLPLPGSPLTRGARGPKPRP